MSYEEIKNASESHQSNEFKSEIKKMIEQYTLLDQKTRDYKNTEDQKKKLNIEYDLQIEKIVEKVVFELKKSKNKEQVLNDFSDAFHELNVQRSPSRYLEDSDDLTDPSSEAYFLRKIIHSLAS